MKKLKEIVEVLSQIVALKCSAQDGGPGSGQKGHTTAAQEFLARRQQVMQNKIDSKKSKNSEASQKLKHNNTPETLYKEGMGAAHRRAKQADSPYEKGSPEHKHWLVGYKSYGYGGK